MMTEEKCPYNKKSSPKWNAYSVKTCIFGKAGKLTLCKKRVLVDGHSFLFQAYKYRS